MPVKILLLAHDLSDAAVHRRAVMLRMGGASVMVAGFRRTPEPTESVAGCPSVDWGRTYNERFFQRIFSIMRQTAFLGWHRALFADADVIIARNLEMLALGVRGRSLCRPAPVLVYECLDIHRLLLRRDFIGAALRWLEGWLSRRASALITSSPAFVSGYFNTLSQVRLPVRVVENKMLDIDNVKAMQ
jgi:succinoglycan biosynthesis protein ExoL